MLALARRLDRRQRAPHGVLTFDYEGSTPIEGGSHFQERRWRSVLDVDRCRGVWSCWAVCPEAVFEKRQDVRKTQIAHPEPSSSHHRSRRGRLRAPSPPRGPVGSHPRAGWGNLGASPHRVSETPEPSRASKGFQGRRPG